MYCEKCGAQIEDNSAVCNNCGAAVSTGYESASSGMVYTPTGNPDNVPYGQPIGNPGYAQSGPPMGNPGYAQSGPTIGNPGYTQPGQQAPVYVVQKLSNNIGTAGFVLALLGVIFSWVPILGWILWALGLILSCVGLAQAKNGKPKGLAIAGLVLSLIGIVILIVVIGSLGAALGAMMLF